MNAGEQPEDAIRRELIEEIGLELEEVRMLRVRTIDRHVEILFRAMSGGEAEIRSREITGIGWFAAAELPEMSAAQKKFIEQVLNSEG